MRERYVVLVAGGDDFGSGGRDRNHNLDLVEVDGGRGRLVAVEKVVVNIC